MQGDTLFDADDPATQRESEVRKKRLHFGLVFQSFNLFPQYTALRERHPGQASCSARNGLTSKPTGSAILEEIQAEGRELLAKMGLSDRADHYPQPALRRPAAAGGHRPGPGPPPGHPLL